MTYVGYFRFIETRSKTPFIKAKFTFNCIFKNFVLMFKYSHISGSHNLYSVPNYKLFGGEKLSQIIHHLVIVISKNPHFRFI